VKLTEAVKELASAKGIAEELIIDTTKEVLISAFKNFKEMENIKITEGSGKALLNIYVVKDIVKRVRDAKKQINVKDAKKISEELDEGQQVDIEVDPSKEFKEKEINWIIENILSGISKIEKDSIKFEYAKKRNKLVTGTIIKKDDKGNIFVDLGKTIGILPLEEQSAMEHYETDDRIKSVVKEVFSDRGNIKRRKDQINAKNVQVVLSRTSPELVKELLSIEVPEISDGTIEVKRIIRDPGYKTKIGVFSDVVDPVSSCIGPHGMRITNVVKELGGEKIDIIRYSDDPKTFIKAAMTPAKVNRIIIQDANSKTVFAVVEKDQLSYAYGKQKKNVVLAARLTGWKINVKTEAEIVDEKIESEDIKGLHDIFETGTPITDLPDLDPAIIAIFEAHGVNTVEKILEIDEANSYAEIAELKDTDIQKIKKVLSESVEYEEESIENETETESETEESIECPHCNFVFPVSSLDLKKPACPNCKELLEIEIEE